MEQKERVMNMRKNNHGGYKYKLIKESIKLLGYPCQKCGSKKFVRLSYKDGNHLNYDKSNWVRLCASCVIRKSWEPRKYKTDEERKERAKVYRLNRNKELGIFPMEVPSGYYSSPQVAKLLGVSRQRVCQLIQSNKIFPEKYGKNRQMFKVDYIDNYIQSHNK